MTQKIEKCSGLRTVSTSVIIILLSVIFMLLVGERQIVLSKNHYIEDLWRRCTVILAGLVAGYMIRGTQILWKIHLQENSDLIEVSIRLLAGFLVLILYVGLHMYRNNGLPYITWRTPIATVALLWVLFNFVELNRKLQREMVEESNHGPGLHQGRDLRS